MLRDIFESLEAFFEKWYLTATIFSGLLTAIVLAAPVVVTVGYFLLILPGVFLSLMPVSFLWLISFGGFWSVGRKLMPSFTAFAFSMTIGFLIVWGAPLTHRFVAKAQLAPYAEANVYPEQAIELAGNIRLDLSEGNNQTQTSSDLPCLTDCVNLLFFKGVKSVTVSHTLDATPLRGAIGGEATKISTQTATYRLVPKSQCDVPSAITQLSGDANNPVVKARQIRLASEVCIVRSLPDAEAIDFTFMQRQTKIDVSDSSRNLWGLRGVNAIDVSSFKILDANEKVLLSEQMIKADIINAPLIVVSDGHLLNGIYFRWLRQTINSRAQRVHAQAELNRSEIIAKHTNFRVENVEEAKSQSVAPVLRAALNDPQRTSDDPAFGLIEMYFRQIWTTNPTDADIVLIRDIIADQRVKQLPELYMVLRKMGNRNEVFVQPILARLKLAHSYGERDFVQNLNALLYEMGPNVFATLKPEVVEFLDSEELRRAAPNLVMRQSDRGAEALPFLMETMAFHASARASIKAQGNSDNNPDYAEHSKVINQIREAICRIGPTASAALPKLKDLQQSGSLDTSEVEAWKWHIMLVRLGTPVQNIRKPENERGNDSKYRKRLLDYVMDEHRPVWSMCGS
jgi:hypothetical protein